MKQKQREQLIRMLATKNNTIRAESDFSDGYILRYSVKHTPIGEVFFDEEDNELWTYEYRSKGSLPDPVIMDEKQLSRFDDWLLEEGIDELSEFLDKYIEKKRPDELSELLEKYIKKKRL